MGDDPDPYPSPDMADVELVGLLRALGDPVRLEIVQLLAGGADCPKIDSLDLGLSKSTVSHHFRALREAGLTRTAVHGRTHDTQLRREELDEKFPGLIDALVHRGPGKG